MKQTSLLMNKVHPIVMTIILVAMLVSLHDCMNIYGFPHTVIDFITLRSMMDSSYPD